MNQALALEAEIASLNAHEMEQLSHCVCEQLHRLEALVGLSISVPKLGIADTGTALEFKAFDCC